MLSKLLLLAATTAFAGDRDAMDDGRAAQHSAPLPSAGPREAELESKPEQPAVHSVRCCR